jgi:hypothetical protein
MGALCPQPMAEPDELSHIHEQKRTYSRFAMSSKPARARAVAQLRAVGFRSSVRDTQGLLLRVRHTPADGPAVQETVLRADPAAMIMIP